MHGALPVVSSSSLCGTLKSLEVSTYTMLALAMKAKIPFPETAITAINLTTLCTLHPNETVLIDHMGQEATSGADWEWWLVGRRQVLGLRVQAKRIYKSSHAYDRLGESNKNGRQVDLLIKEASASRTYPIYCFYNTALKPSDLSRWNCGTYSPSATSMGCAIAGATAIRSMIDQKKKKVADILPHCLPWSCLVCCPRGRGLIERASMVLSALGSDEGTRMELPTRDRDDLPVYVRQALNSNMLPRVGFDHDIPSSLSHVLVTLDTSEDQ